MKRIVSIILSALIIFTTAVVAGAESTDFESANLLDKYSTQEIIAMYPEVSSYLAREFRALNTDIALGDYNISVENIDAIYFSVLSENPDIFYVSPHDFASTSESESDILVSIRPKYLFKTEEIPDKIAEFKKSADYILAGVDKNWSDVYKCRYLHDMIAQYVHYDMDVNNSDMLIRTAYGALIDNNAVCEGYTMAYNYLLGQLGIEAHFIQSTKMLHAWSYVKLGGSYYHVDVTYDDPSYDNLGRVNHDYCLVSDKQLSADGEHHDWIHGTKASDTSLDNVWWRNINTIIFPIDGYDYYMDQTYNSSVYGALMRRNIETGSKSLIKQVSTRWNVDGISDAFWERAYCYLTYDGEYLYFNDTQNVYRHKPDGSANCEVLYKKPESIKYNFYGVAMKMDGNLYATIKQNPNVEDEVYFLDKNALDKNPDKPIEPDKNVEYVEVDGGISISKLNITSENLIIPEYIDGKKVVMLGDSLFSGNQNLKSVIIPEGITAVGNSTFYNCANLKSITVPSTLTSIGNGAFNGCASLDEITIPKSVVEIGKNAFSGCLNLTIKGYRNSVAESYSNEYKIHFVCLDSSSPTNPTSPTNPSSPTNPTSPANPTSPTEPKPKRKTINGTSSMYVKQKGSIKISSKEKFTYTSSKKSVAVIDKKGKITAKKKGTATITASSKSLVYKIKLTVKNPKLNVTKKKIKKGKSFKLKVIGGVGKTTYTSSKKKVATVSPTGKVKAKKKGSATITVKTSGKIKLKCKVTVK